MPNNTRRFKRRRVGVVRFVVKDSISKALLSALRDLLRPMSDWTQKSTTQAEVKIFILDNLYGALPRPPFADDETDEIAERIYDYVWQRSASGDNVLAA